MTHLEGLACAARGCGYHGAINLNTRLRWGKQVKAVQKEMENQVNALARTTASTWAPPSPVLVKFTAW